MSDINAVKPPSNYSYTSNNSNNFDVNFVTQSEKTYLNTIKSQFPKIFTTEENENIKTTKWNTYYFKKYKAQNKLYIFIIIICIIIISLTFINKNYKYFDNLSYNIIIGVIVGLSIIYIAMDIWYIYKKDDMNFDEIDYGSGPGIQYNINQNTSPTNDITGTDISLCDISFNPISKDENISKIEFLKSLF